MLTERLPVLAGYRGVDIQYSTQSITAATIAERKEEIAHGDARLFHTFLEASTCRLRLLGRRFR
jgi:hypothetical protein